MTMSEAAAPAQAAQNTAKKPLPELTGPQKAAAVVIAMELLRKLKSGAKEAVCHEGGA